MLLLHLAPLPRSTRRKPGSPAATSGGAVKAPQTVFWTDPPPVPGRALGYQQQGSKYYGRCPCLMPIRYWLPYKDAGQVLQVIGFHAPFGRSTEEGIGYRRDAMLELLQGGTHEGSVESSANVLVIGDFNLNYTGSSSGTSIPGHPVCAIQVAGFQTDDRRRREDLAYQERTNPMVTGPRKMGPARSSPAVPTTTCS